MEASRNLYFSTLLTRQNYYLFIVIALTVSCEAIKCQLPLGAASGSCWLPLHQWLSDMCDDIEEAMAHSLECYWFKTIKRVLNINFY